MEIRGLYEKPTSELTKADLEKVELLKLGSTQLTDTDLKELAKLQQLTDLDLRFTKITDARLVFVARLYSQAAPAQAISGVLISYWSHLRRPTRWFFSRSTGINCNMDLSSPWSRTVPFSSAPDVLILSQTNRKYCWLQKLAKPEPVP